MRRYVLFLHLLGLAAQGQPMGAPANGMGACTLGSKELAVMYNRPASLADTDPGLQLYLHRPYLLLSRNWIGAAARLAGGTIGLHLSSNGRAFYRENGLGLAFGKRLSQVLDAGVHLRYTRLRLNKEYYRSGIHYGLGAVYAFTEQLKLGVQLQDLLLESSYINFGMQYQAAEMLRCVLEIDIGSQSGYRLGCEYSVYERFFLRCGFNSQPLSWAFGFGWKKQRFGFDIALVQHLSLGTSPHLSFKHVF